MSSHYRGYRQSYDERIHALQNTPSASSMPFLPAVTSTPPSHQPQAVALSQDFNIPLLCSNYDISARLHGLPTLNYMNIPQLTPTAFEKCVILPSPALVPH